LDRDDDGVLRPGADRRIVTDDAVRSLEAELARARDLDEADLADAVESIGFECTRCGACCKAEADDPHTATVFPDEVRRLQAAVGDDAGVGDAPDDDDDGGNAERDWREVARPMPYGLRDGESGAEGETFEWALAADACGDCTFYAEDDDGVGACTVHDARPLICRTYPFSVALAGTSQPMGEAVDEAGVVRAHECEGLGRDISRTDAEELAAALKERAVRELEEAIAVRDGYEPTDTAPGEVVVHDSEGAKRPDGTTYDE
jgi:Fe-S-cluster containining protein